MKKLIIVSILFVIGIQSAEAQLKRTWKNQIYGGFNGILGGDNFVNSKNFDFNYVTKSQWLFNAGLTHTSYVSPLNQSGFTLTAKPKIAVHQFNLSFGKRIDLLPKWSISLYGGLSYTRCKFPTNIIERDMKIGSFYPISFGVVGAEYGVKKSLGVHFNGELNFYLCENLSFQAGYMIDLNSTHKLGGFSLGVRVGLMKQKYGTRRISRIRV